MIVCLVLYILSCVLCYFIICVCQLEHVYESLYDCVLSCIYCRTSLMLFHYRCVSVRTFVWKYCMIVCLVLYILSYILCYFIIGVCHLEHVYESFHACVSCPVYIVVRLVLFYYRYVSVRACVWTFVWLCVVLYISSYVLCYFTIGVCQLEHVYDSLYDCVSCPVYIVVLLRLFHYMCV